MSWQLTAQQRVGSVSYQHLGILGLIQKILFECNFSTLIMASAHNTMLNILLTCRGRKAVGGINWKWRERGILDYKTLCETYMRTGCFYPALPSLTPTSSLESKFLEAQLNKIFYNGLQCVLVYGRKDHTQYF